MQIPWLTRSPHRSAGLVGSLLRPPCMRAQHCQMGKESCSPTAHTVPVRTVYRHRGRARSAIPLPRVRARARTRGKGIPCSRIRAIPYLLPKLGRREKALPQARAGGGAHLPPGMSQSSLAFEKIKQHPGPRHRQRRIAERGRRSDPIPSVP